MTFKNKVQRRLSELIKGEYRLVEVEISLKANEELNEAFFVHKKIGSSKYLKQLAGVPAKVNSRMVGKVLRVRFYDHPSQPQVIRDEMIEEDPANEVVTIK